MRASGAFAAEHILTAFAISPARMHFCIVARNTSLLIDAPKRYSDLSTRTPIVMIDQKRITYIPHPPSLKCFHTAAIEPSSVFVDSPSPPQSRGAEEGPRPTTEPPARDGLCRGCPPLRSFALRRMSCERAVDLEFAVHARTRDRAR